MRAGLWRGCASTDKLKAMYENCHSTPISDMPNWLRAATASAVLGAFVHDRAPAIVSQSCVGAVFALFALLATLSGMCGSSGFGTAALMSAFVVAFDVIAPALWTYYMGDGPATTLTGLGVASGNGKYGYAYILAWIAAGLSLLAIPMSLLSRASAKVSP
jgi:hypothetical protein